MKETVHEMWTIGTDRLNKESLTASQWSPSAMGAAPYVSKTSPQGDHYVTKRKERRNVTVYKLRVCTCLLCSLICGALAYLRMLWRQWVMNWNGCRKKWSSPNFRLLSWNLPGGTGVNHGFLIQDSWSFGRVLNQAPSEYKSDTVQFVTFCSVVGVVNSQLLCRIEEARNTYKNVYLLT